MTNGVASQFITWFFLLFPVGILENGKNFMIWAWRYFSVGFFATRLFSPWHRDITSYGRGFNLNNWLHALAWNFISRFIGAVFRIICIALGLLVEVVFFLATLLLFVTWYALPALVIILIGTSF